MTIADFTLTRQLTYRNGAPADGTRPLYAIYKLGGTVFAGAGRYENATRDRLNAQGSWYGYPENNVVVPRSTVSRASFPALAGYTGDATTLQIAVGCFNGSVDTACTAAGGRRHLAPALRRPGRAQRPDRAGRRRSRRRACWPAAAAPAPTPSRSTPTDNGGIRRVEIVDVSGGGAVVGARGLRAPARAPTPARPARSASRKACPNLSNETVRPTSLAAGRRTLKVRVIDAGGNVTRAGPVRGRRRHAVGPRRRSTAAARPRTAR